MSSGHVGIRGSILLDSLRNNVEFTLQSSSQEMGKLGFLTDYHPWWVESCPWGVPFQHFIWCPGAGEGPGAGKGPPAGKQGHMALGWEAASVKDTVHLPQVNSDGSWADSGQSNNSSYSPGLQLPQSFLPANPWRPRCANGLPLVARPCLLSSPCWLTLSSCPHLCIVSLHEIVFKIPTAFVSCQNSGWQSGAEPGVSQKAFGSPYGKPQARLMRSSPSVTIDHGNTYSGTTGPQCLLARISFPLEDHLLKPHCCPVLVMLIMGDGVLSTLENSDLKENSGLFFIPMLGLNLN